MSAKDSIATQTCELSKEEFTNFLTLYPIPSEYCVILPKFNQTIFDAPPRFIYLGLTLFVVSSSPLLLSCARLMVVSPLLTSSEGSSICVELQNKLDSKSFKDKLPPNIKENPMFHLLGRYSMSVHVFLDPILFLTDLKPSWEYGQQRHAIIAGGKEMTFKNFIYTEDDEDLSFLPKEPSPCFGTEVTADSKESLKPKLFVVHPGSVAAQIKDKKCKTRGGSSRPPIKRKLTPGSSTSRATCSKTSSSKDDVPYLTVFDDDEDVELLDFLNCCYTRQAVVDNVVNRRSRKLLQVIEKLRGKFYVMKDMERAREEECKEMRAKFEAAMTEFEKNPTVVALREKLSTLSTKVKEHKVSLDIMMLESQKWAGYQQSLSTLESKVTSLEAEKARLEAVEVSLRKEVDELKPDRREVVLKVVPYAAMKLVHSDDMGSLVGRLVSSAILYGRCRAYDQVDDMKDPFNLSKVKGYRSSYKKDHTQASNDLATATFP
ncbi:hypothetical protein Tco_0891407 [Tanacetum coccineum]|uniref:Uncharacterized protein n=1 Tax=Tanacetum coccineum TaxID=301880 RepID=A0ABQ5C354_9ASTR